MERSATSPDEHLASLDDTTRQTMEAVDRIVVESMPGRARVLWEGVFWGGSDQSIIGYGEIVQTRSKGDPIEWFAVGLARQSASYSLYVNAVDDGAYLGRQFGTRLGKVKIGAASIGFKRIGDLDLDVLAEMLRRAHELTPPDEHL